MPLFASLIILVSVIIIGAVQAARPGRLGWIKTRGIDALLFLLSLTSLAISIFVLATIARFESDTNITVAGTALNIPLLLAPVLLFIVTILLAVRLISGAKDRHLQRDGGMISTIAPVNPQTQA